MTTADYLYFLIPYRAPLRGTPSIVATVPNLYNGSAGAIGTISGTGAYALTDTQMYLQVLKYAHGFTPATGAAIWGDVIVTVDNEMY